MSKNLDFDSLVHGLASMMLGPHMPKMSTRLVVDDRDIKNLKQNGEFRVLGHRNLVLRATPFSKTWLKMVKDGESWRKVTLGKWPDMSMEQAAGQSITLPEKPDGPMTGALFNIYLAEKKRQLRPRTFVEMERIIEKDVRPCLADKPASGLTKRDIAACIDAVAARGSTFMADRTFAVLKTFFGWCVGTGKLDVDPSVGLKKRNGGKARTRVLNDDEIRTLWHALDTWDRADRDLFKLQLLLGVRIGEAAGATKAEVDFEKKLWTIPAERTKSNREHVLPLPPTALSILKTIEPLPFKAATQALMRLIDQLKMSHFSSHDLRRTCATKLGELGVDDGVVERVLNHAPAGVTRQRYNHAAKVAEMRKALELWDARVSQLVAQRPVSADKQIALT